MVSVVDAVRDVVAPLVASRGLELVDVEAGPGLVRVYVDQPGGVDLEVLTDASDVISRALDDHDPVPGSYTLEVSSPGLERPLKTPEHFQRFVGAQVKVRARPAASGRRVLEGVLARADAEGIAVDTDGGTEVVAYADIDRARTVFEWGPTPKPGKTPKSPKSPKKKRTPTR